MAREVIDTKIRTLIKAYLTFNKGKKCTAKEIAELVGSWAWDEISINDEPIPEYLDFCPIFKERGWEETEGE